MIPSTFGAWSVWNFKMVDPGEFFAQVVIPWNDKNVSESDWVLTSDENEDKIVNKVINNLKYLDWSRLMLVIVAKHHLI